MNTEEGILISIRNLSKTFSNGKENLKVIEKLNLDIRNKEFISIVGPSGCGKSTLIDLILEHKSYNGGEIQKHLNNQENISVVWQEDFLIPWKTIFQNIEYPLIIKGINKKERKKRINFWLETIGLTKFSKYYPNQISQGMKKRVALASIMVTNPKIVFFDEPFTGLDSDTKKNIQYKIFEIWKKLDLTMVLITHDIQEAVSMSNRILVMSRSPSRIVHEEFISETKDFKNQFTSEDFYNKIRKLTAKIEDLW